MVCNFNLPCSVQIYYILGLVFILYKVHVLKIHDQYISKSTGRVRG